MTHCLSVDFETRSVVELRQEGVYVYAQHPLTDLWCMAYAFDDEPVTLWHPGLRFPDRVGDFIAHRRGYLRAWNAQFERLIWKYVLGPRYTVPTPDLDQWICTAALGARCGLPRNLEDAAIAMRLPFGKDMAGHKLMMQMAKPRKVHDDGTITWWDDQPRRDRLYQYCPRDVEAERGIFDRLPPVGGWRERDVWLLDQQMNDEGVLLDTALAQTGLLLTTRAIAAVNANLRRVTNGSAQKVTALAKIKEWLADEGMAVGSLAKIPMKRLLADPNLTTEVRHVLELRKEGGKASTAKYRSMLRWVCTDNVLRGMLLYHGAGTGRWAGKGPQPQNFIKGTVKLTPTFVNDVKQNDLPLLTALYGSPMEALASALPACFMAQPKHDFIGADFNAIEARVVAWLFNSTKLVSLFANKGKVYEAMAAVIYNVPIDTIIALKQKADAEGIECIERFIGKNTVLGCGFQMGAATFKRQLREKFGIEISLKLAERAVEAYRSDNPEIPDGWKSMNKTAIQVVREGITTWMPVPATDGKLHFRLWKDWLQMRLPSGRSLWYAQPEIVSRLAPWTKTVKQHDGTTIEEPVYTDAVAFMGVHPKYKGWYQMTLYGGLLTENAVQAIARDLLADAMLRAGPAGYRPVLTVHDELVTQVRRTFGTVEAFVALMCDIPEWAEGCPVAAEGWRGPRYKMKSPALAA